MKSSSGSAGTKYPGLHPLPPPFVKEYPPLAKVVEERCIACDRCPPVCFFDALFMYDEPAHKYRRVARVVPENCTGCGLCFEACPVDAIVWVPDVDETARAAPSKAPPMEDRDI
jgi:formate hydrogenlyase subunit 6/NADH:ubiquinone oxidoreductase subunit I